MLWRLAIEASVWVTFRWLQYCLLTAPTVLNVTYIISLCCCAQKAVATVLSHVLQVLFALHDKSLLSGMELDGVTTCSIEPIHTGSSKVDIFLELFETPQGSVVGHIEYDSSLWQRYSIQSLATAFKVTF